MIYEVTSAGHVRRYTHHEEPCCHLRHTSTDVVLVDRDFQEVSTAHPGAVYFQLHRDVAELMRTWDVAIYARVKQAMPRLFETAVCLLMLSETAQGAARPESARPESASHTRPESARLESASHTRPESARPESASHTRPECARQQEANSKEQIRWAISALRKYNVECAQR